MTSAAVAVKPHLTSTTVYRNNVEALVAGPVNQRITNSGFQHGAIVLECLFRIAKKKVRIYSRKLQTVYSDEGVLNAAKSFVLEKGGKVKILVEDVPSVEGKTFIQAIKHPNVRIRMVDSNFPNPQKHHFAVADNTAYRIELDDDNEEAIANFLEPEIADVLANTFDSVFNNGHDMTEQRG
jgi:hypothetical protein